METYAALKTHTHTGADGTSKLLQANTHQSPDTDAATSSLHHTIGTSATQASAGNHTHASPLRTFAYKRVSATSPDGFTPGGMRSMGALTVTAASVPNNGVGKWLVGFNLTVSTQSTSTTAFTQGNVRFLVNGGGGYSDDERHDLTSTIAHCSGTYPVEITSAGDLVLQLFMSSVTLNGNVYQEGTGIWAVYLGL